MGHLHTKDREGVGNFIIPSQRWYVWMDTERDGFGEIIDIRIRKVAEGFGGYE